MREILVCVTFREFDGGRNARIQERMLQSLREQTYRNFRLVATNYREQNVLPTLKASGIRFEFHQSRRTDCRFSWSEVVSNSFEHLEPGRHIIFWTQADCIFRPNLFEEMVRHFEPRSGGTSYPHLQYESIEDYDQGRPLNNSRRPGRKTASFYSVDPNYWVPDAVYVDGDLMLDDGNRKLFLDHDIRDAWPGMVQTLFLAFFADKLKNLVYRSPIAEITNVRAEDLPLLGIAQDQSANDRQAAAKAFSYSTVVQEQWTRSRDTLWRFAAARGIPARFMHGRLRKLRQIKEYKVVGRPDQKAAFALYLAIWGLYRRLRPRRPD